ncbi:methyltransferase, FkbM family [Belliella buryatensis]|uniref:Methyltransferase, FkbM family n=1 Tax=Belliella buryatensis TaxID=1500549 RepID=A0A239CU90_9BACT|nr:methyltransferase, FkbM family [Belliella buryatensis]
MEPNPVIFRLLEKNIKDNNLTNITLFNCCLSNKEGFEDFFFENESTNNLSGSIYETRGNEFQVKVKSIKLSSIMKDELFDLIKIDVEGAERQIFQDLVENDKIKLSDSYFIEYHHHSNMENVFSEMISFFETKGFKFNLRSVFKKPTSFQDILIFFHKKII